MDSSNIRECVGGHINCLINSQHRKGNLNGWDDGQHTAPDPITSACGVMLLVPTIQSLYAPVQEPLHYHIGTIDALFVLPKIGGSSRRGSLTRHETRFVAFAREMLSVDKDPPR